MATAQRTSKQAENELTRDNLIEQLVRYGYFHEYIPPCFNTESLSEKIDSILSYIQSINKPYELHSQPLSYSIYKNDHSRRTISIPNPLPFLNTVSFMKEHWERCCDLAKSDNSQSPITFMFDYTQKILLNADSQRNLLGIASSFVENLIEMIKLSIGYPYKLSLDLQDFYGSIYTHSLTWVLCGKDYAKAKHIKAHISVDSEKEELYSFADELDRLIRSQKSDETNGIITGPFTSRIFSEILLAGIDRIFSTKSSLSSRAFVFKRYVDDYSFYFHSEQDAKRGCDEIAKILGSFDLCINYNKVTLESYPFDILVDFEKELFGSFAPDKAFPVDEVLNKAGQLILKGEKGAYRYALKRLAENKKSIINARSLAQLVNIGISDPNCSMLVCDFLTKHQEEIAPDALEPALNNILADALDNNLEQEATNAFYFLFRLGLKVCDSSMRMAISASNDLCRLMALDLMRNQPDRILYTSLELKDLENAKKELENALDGVPINSSRWLLIYESLNHDLLAVNPLKDGGNRWNSFFKELAAQDVSFYSGLGKPDFTWCK